MEHINAWIDAFKALLMRYEKLAVTWLGMQCLRLFLCFVEN